MFPHGALDTQEYYKLDKYDRIRILVAKAEYAMLLGGEAKDRGTREERFDEAAKQLNAAMRIDQTELLPQLGRGQLALTRGNLDEAAKLFDMATERRDNKLDSIMPLLGKACVLYHKKLYPGALRLYEAALRQHPRAPAAVRLGIGLCHFKLGNLDRAKAAFRRTLQVREVLLGSWRWFESRVRDDAIQSKGSCSSRKTCKRRLEKVLVSFEVNLTSPS